MESEKAKCVWCEEEYDHEEMAVSRFLGGLVCRICDADEGSRTLGEIHTKLKEHSADGIGWVK